MVTDAQVRRLREKRMSGKTLAAAAAAAGMSERTARQWQSGPLPSTAKAPRTWRTREDPFAEVWESEVVPQLVADTDGRLQVLTLFKALCRRHPGRFQEGQLRTLQRRVRDWRVQYGADREVYFEQVAVAGREAAFDFTDASDLRVTIRGVPFAHLLFEWVLSYSKWTYVGLALSETFEALVAGLQGALWMLGAVPALLRHDNLSAATHELKTQRRAPVDGAVPAGAGPLRAALVADPAGETARERGGRAGALPNEDGHRAGVAVAGRQRLRGRVGVSGLRACGRRRGAEQAGGGTVGRGAFVSAAVAGGTDPGVHDVPVPGAQVEHDSHRQPDLLGAVAPDRSHGRSAPASVDGRGPLRRPGAVHDATAAGLGGPPDRLSAHHRESGPQAGRLCPVSLPGRAVSVADVRSAYDALGRTHGERADVEYVRLLHLAATISERQVEATLRARLDAGVACDYASVQAEVSPPVPTIPVVNIPRPDLTRYNALLTGGLQG